MQSVEQALEQLGRLEPDVAAQARGVWARLLSDSPGDADPGRISESGAVDLRGASPQGLTQRRLQRFCWFELAQSVQPPGVRWQQAQALAALLEVLGMNRYAQIAGGSTTREVLATAEHSPERSRSLARRASERSGVEPPSTELLTWGSQTGPAEARAKTEVADTLEFAVAAGDLVPGARGWRERQGEIAVAVLTTPRADLDGNSLYRAVLTERMAAWVRGAGSTTRAAVLAPVAARLIEPIEPLGSSVVRAVLRPLDWLLTEVDDGVTLTAAGYLPPRMVARAVDRLGWTGEILGPLTREADAYPVLVLRESATRLGLVRRRGNRLLLTPSGRSGIENGDALAAVVASRLIGPEHSAMAAVWEMVLTALSGGDEVVEADLCNLVRVMLREAGWVPADVDPDEALEAPLVFSVLRELRWLELTAELGPMNARRIKARSGAVDLFRMALRHRVLHRDVVVE